MTHGGGQCPDWPRLIVRREVAGAEDSAEWLEALAHRSACSRCRQASLEADPLMIFAGLPSADVSDLDIADMQARVAVQRRGETTARGREWLRPSRFPVWLRTAAAAAALAVTVGVVQLGLLPGSRTSESVGPDAVAEDAPGTDAIGDFSRPSLPEDLALLPLVEGLELQQARVYQMTEGDLDLVMIVDGSLDI